MLPSLRGADTEACRAALAKLNTLPLSFINGTWRAMSSLDNSETKALKGTLRLADLRRGGFSVADLTQRGCGLNALVKAGYTLHEVADHDPALLVKFIGHKDMPWLEVVSTLTFAQFEVVVRHLTIDQLRVAADELGLDRRAIVSALEPPRKPARIKAVLIDRLVEFARSRAADVQPPALAAATLASAPAAAPAALKASAPASAPASASASASADAPVPRAAAASSREDAAARDTTFTPVDDLDEEAFLARFLAFRQARRRDTLSPHPRASPARASPPRAAPVH